MREDQSAAAVSTTLVPVPEPAGRPLSSCRCCASDRQPRISAGPSGCRSWSRTGGTGNRTPRRRPCRRCRGVSSRALLHRRRAMRHGERRRRGGEGKSSRSQRVRRRSRFAGSAYAHPSTAASSRETSSLEPPRRRAAPRIRASSRHSTPSREGLVRFTTVRFEATSSKPLFPPG